MLRTSPLITASGTSGNRTTLQYGRKKKQRKARFAGPWMVAAIAVLAVLLLWAIGALLFAVVSSSQSNKHPAPAIVPFPRKPLDLWPDDSSLQSQRLLESFYSSCVPTALDDNDKCPVPPSTASTKTVTIIRSPGVFGKLLESFVRQFIQLHAPHIPVILASQHHPLKSLSSGTTYLIRPAVLPPILEALDLILETRNVDDTTLVGVEGTQTIITVEEILEVVRLVVQWHCRISVVYERSPRWTLTLDHTMAYPKVTEESLAEFLGLEQEIKPDVNVSPLAEQTLQRIHDVSVWAERLPNLTTEILQQALEEMLQNDNNSCLSDPPDRVLVQPQLQTRVTDLVGAFLWNTPVQTVVCERYPKSLLCQQRQQP
jgi:hypothetical protein